MEKRYGALRFIALVHKVAAGVALLYSGLNVVGVIFLRTVIGSTANATYYALAILGSLLVALLLWAIAESILVIIDIEANTRRSADLLASRESATAPEKR